MHRCFDTFIYGFGDGRPRRGFNVKYVFKIVNIHQAGQVYDIKMLIT